MNSTSKKFGNKSNISKIAYAGGVAGSVGFQNWEGHRIIRNPFLGQWYDLHEPIYELEGINFINLEEIKAEIYLSQNNTIFHADDRLSHQAMTYVGIIEELTESNNLSCPSLLPAFTALKACFSAGWKPLTIPKSILNVSILLLGNLDGNLQELGKDILTLILILSPSISEEVIVFLMDNAENNQLTQQYISILHQCLVQIMQSSFSAVLNKVLSRGSCEKQVEKADLSGEEKLQLGNRIQFFTSLKEWKHGHIVKINNIEGNVAIEYEDVDENNNSVIKLESILVSEAWARIQSLTIEPIGNASTSALIDGTPIAQNNPIQKLTVLKVFNNSEMISKIINLAYFQVHGSCLASSHMEGMFKCTCCASDLDTRIFIPPRGSSCTVCTITSTNSAFFVHCVSCNSMICKSCAQKGRDRKLLITLNSQEPCPIYRSMDAKGEIISSVVPFSQIEVIDRFGSSFFELVMDGNYKCGYIPKILIKKSSSWKTVVKIDISEPTSCEYFGSLIKKLILIDHLRKELVLSLPSISVEKHNQLHDLYSQVLESAYSLFSSNLSIIFCNSMEEQCYSDEEDDIAYSHDDKTATFLRLGDSNEVDHNNILDILAPVLSRPIEKIGIMAFGSIFSLIILSITEYADKLIDNMHSTISPEAFHSYSILRVLFASEHRCILIPCFFRVMIAKSGLAAKRMVNLRKLQMANNFSVETCMDSFLWFEKLQDAYIVALTHPLIQLTNVYSQGIIAKVQNTIRALGHGSLANLMIEIYYKDIFYQEVEDHPFQNYLKSHILVPFNRFSSSSKLARKFLRELTSFCSNDCLSELEQIWRNLLTDFAYENMLKLYQQTNNILFSDIYDEAVNVCKGLRQILEQLRSASRVDMCVGGITYMSSDFAFESAYRRLFRDVSILFSRAVCICLSSNLDESLLQSASNNNRESVDNIMDIIDVLFHKNSAEFQHFYEILLARRLIKCRAISYVLESHLISELPPIAKGDLMLHDIGQSVQYTSAFRSHLLTRMDKNNTVLSDEIVQLILREKNFSLIVLTGSVWPSFLISPMHFANLRLPNEMQMVKEEFYHWVSPVSIANVDHVAANATAVSGKRCQAFYIQGSKRNPVRINGIFFVTDEIKDGWPIYAMEGNGGSILEYSSSSFSWQIKRRIDQGNNTGVAYCKVENGSSPEGSQRLWFVWEKETKTWVTDTIEVSECVISSSSFSKAEKGNNPSMVNTSIARSSSGKRYVWCHGAGSVTLCAHIQPRGVDATKYCMMSMSEPQAAIVMLFNSVSLSQDVLVGDIRKAINISGSELNSLLFSLTSAEFPLLLPVDAVISQFSPTYKYASTMRLVLNISMLKGLCEEKEANEIEINYSKDLRTVFLPSIIFHAADSDSNIMNSDHLVLQGWRNDQIDACIVRLLKYAMRDKSGEFPCELNSNEFVALSIDTLSSLVRAQFINEGDIPIETIVKRCERLVTIGVIDKLHGNKETLRSIAYCYTLDSNPLSEVHPDTTKKTVDKKVTGVELFDHLRIVLNIKSSGMEDQGVSLPLLHMKLLAWLMTAKCDLSCPPQSKLNPLESIIKLLATIMDTMILQVNAAKLQYLHTFPDAFRRRKIEDTFLKLPGWQELLNLIVKLKNDDSKWPVLCLSLGFMKAFLSCLPVEVLLAILKAFGKNWVVINHLQVHWIQYHAEEADDCEIVHNVLHPLEFNHRRSSVLAQIDLLWSEKSTFSYDSLFNLGISQESVRNVKSLLSLNLKNTSLGSKEATTKSQSSAVTPNLKFPTLGIQTDAKETDIKQPLDCSKNVSLSLEEFVSVVFFQVSIELSDSVDARWEKMCKDVDCSLASILHHVFFNRFVDGITKMFDIPLPFLDDYLEDGDRNDLGRPSTAAEDSHDLPSEDEGDMDNMIPCEFCSDNIPMNIFEVHVLVCQRGLHLPAPHQLARLARHEGADVALRHAANWLRLSVEHMDRLIPPSWAEYQDILAQSVPTSFNDSPAVSTTTAFTTNRPQPDSPLALLLCRSIIDHLLQAAAKQSHVENMATCENNTSDGDSMDTHSNSSPHIYTSSGFYTSDVNFQEIVNDLFHILDRDKDGVLTISDFMNNPMQLLNSLYPVDPFLLYGNKDKKNQFNSDMLMTTPRGISSDRQSRTPFSSSSLLSSTRSIFYNTRRDQDHRSSPFASTGIPLHKTDSLRYSLSNEKSFPKMTPSHSYSGLNETEQEVVGFLERARDILDDSESNVLGMLLYYKWDLKTLVEDYIENSRAVRLAVGLGTKNEPPFYRYDYYLETQSVREKTIWNDNKEEEDKNDDFEELKKNGNHCHLLFETKAMNNANNHAMTVTCGICADTVDSREAFALPCCHWYCLICWEGYIETALNGRQLIRHCPSPECKFLVVPDMLTYFASSELATTTKKLIIKSFVEEKRGKRVIGSYCKNPRSCKGVVVMAEDAHSSEAVCSLCATSFCAACDLPPHAPATCEMVAQWEEKGGYLETGKAEDVEARKLKHLTTKPCPKCGVRIEKNGGCPHMTCVQPNCKYQFCWECSGEYHTSSTCNRPKVKTDNNSILLFDELDRQCANYFLARKIALKGKREVDRLLPQVEKHRDTRVYRTIAEGWSTLAEAQSALAHTCILMYFVKSAKIVFLYEHQKFVTQQLQQIFEEEWTNLDAFPVLKARSAIQDLQGRMHDYLLSISAEVVLDRQTNQPVPVPTQSNITNGGSAVKNAILSPPSQVPAVSSTLQTPPRSLPGSPLTHFPATPVLPSYTSSPLVLTSSSLLPKSALLFESKKSPHRILQTARSRSGSYNFSATTILRRQSSSNGNVGSGNVHVDYYDIVNRLSTFSLQEKSDLASEIFGDAFGGSRHIYRALI